MKKLGIVVPTYNRKQLLADLLTQVKEQSDRLKSLKVIPIVVVDGSTDGTIEMLEMLEDVEVVKGDGAWWYTKSMNEGFERAYEVGADLVLTLNDDIRLDENYLSQIELLVEQENVEIIGSISLTMDERPKIFFSGIKDYIRWRLKEVKYIPKLKEVIPEELTGLYPSFLLPGRGILVAVEVLKALKGFDKHFPQYRSDGDFCLRAIKRGFDVKVSYDLKIYSYVGLTAQASSFKKSSFSVFLKSFFNPYSRIYLPQMARYVYRHGIKILWPLSFGIAILSHFKAYFFNKKIE